MIAPDELRDLADRYEYAAQQFRHVAEAIEGATAVDKVKELIANGIIPAKEDTRRTYKCPVGDCPDLILEGTKHCHSGCGSVPAHTADIIQCDDGGALLDVSMRGDRFHATGLAMS